jgi:hypothetical protein
MSGWEDIVKKYMSEYGTAKTQSPTAPVDDSLTSMVTGGQVGSTVTIDDAAQTSWKYQEDNPADYWLALQWLTKTVWGGTTPPSAVSTLVNDQADRFYQENGRPPKAEELIKDQQFYDRGQALLFSQLGVEEGYFTLQDDDGQMYNYILDRDQGMRLVSPNSPTFSPGGTEVSQEDLKKLQASGLDTSGRFTPTLPIYSVSDLRTKLQPRRSGGGSGRQARAYDREALMEQYRNLYRGWTIVDPEDRHVETVVDAYIKQANSFWLSKGGSLDFGTYARTQLRGTADYQKVYRKKPPEMSEEEFIQPYVSVVQQYGLSASNQGRQIRQSAESGGSVEGQATRVGRTREVVSRGDFSRKLASTIQSLGPGVR